MFGLKPKPIGEIEAVRLKLMLDVEATDAKIRDLDTHRQALLMEGSPQDLVDNARSRELNLAFLDQARARMAANEVAMAEREAKDEDDRKRARYAAAKARRAEGVALFKNYEKHAELAANALLGYLPIRIEIAAANADRPEGAPPIEDPEPDNSVPSTRNADNFSTWGSPHVSVLDRAVIPKVARGEYWYGEFNIGAIKR